MQHPLKSIALLVFWLQR